MQHDLDVLEPARRRVGRGGPPQVTDPATQVCFERRAQVAGRDSHWLAPTLPTCSRRRDKTVFESKYVSASSRAARACCAYDPPTASIALVASSVESNANNPSPVGSQSLKPVSCAITGRPAAR